MAVWSICYGCTACYRWQQHVCFSQVNSALVVGSNPTALLDSQQDKCISIIIVCYSGLAGCPLCLRFVPTVDCTNMVYCIGTVHHLNTWQSTGSSVSSSLRHWMGMWFIVWSLKCVVNKVIWQHSICWYAHVWNLLQLQAVAEALLEVVTFI
jgi:hypothetical protein